MNQESYSSCAGRCKLAPKTKDYSPVWYERKMFGSLTESLPNRSNFQNLCKFVQIAEVTMFQHILKHEKQQASIANQIPKYNECPNKSVGIQFVNAIAIDTTWKLKTLTPDRIVLLMYAIEPSILCNFYKVSVISDYDMMKHEVPKCSFKGLLPLPSLE